MSQYFSLNPIPLVQSKKTFYLCVRQSETGNLFLLRTNGLPESMITENMMDAKEATGAYRYATALTIAGSDSCGGAGIQADLKTFSALGVYGMSAITAITAQNTLGVRSIQAVNAKVLRDQIEAVFDDFTIDAVKIGMLYEAEAVRIVAELLERYRPSWVIVDPVMISTSGSKLLRDDAIAEIIGTLFPQAHLVTPNIPEAEYLSGIPVHLTEDMDQAAGRLLEMGCRAVLLKGGHLAGAQKTDWLYIPGQAPCQFTHETIDTRNTHGTGCTLSSAIAAQLALGYPLPEAVREAETYLSEAIREGKEVMAGHGHGPVNHFYSPHKLVKRSVEK